MTQTTPPSTAATTSKPKSRTMLYAIIIVILIVVGIGVYYLTSRTGSGYQIAIQDDGACAQGATACNYNPASYNGTLNNAISWQNIGKVGHTVTTCDSTHPSTQGCPIMNAATLNAWDSGTIGAGASASRTFTVAGTYYYYCTIHPWMHGSLGVK
jgi:plastocyanin